MIAQEHEFGFVFVSVVNQEFIALGDDRNIATHSLHKKANPVDHVVGGEIRGRRCENKIKNAICFYSHSVANRIIFTQWRVVKSMKYSSRSVQNNEV